MKKEFFPYYISRAVLSSIFAILVMGFNLNALLLGSFFFGLFLLYLHSGWFNIDLRYPLAPLRRDSRGQGIQRKALIASIITGLLIHIAVPHTSILFGLSPIGGNIALSIAVITYFVTQFLLLARA